MYILYVYMFIYLSIHTSFLSWLSLLLVQILQTCHFFHPPESTNGAVTWATQKPMGFKFPGINFLALPGGDQIYEHSRPLMYLKSILIQLFRLRHRPKVSVDSLVQQPPPVCICHEAKWIRTRWVAPKREWFGLRIGNLQPPMGYSHFWYIRRRYVHYYIGRECFREIYIYI